MEQNYATPSPDTAHRSHKASSKQGHLALLLANVAWGMMSPVSKHILLQGQLSPLALSAVRIGGATLLFLLLSFILPATIAPREKILRSDYLKLLTASILMISANQGLFILGIGFTNPIDSAVMSSTTPMLTMVLAAIALGFPITRLKCVGVLTGMAGVILLVAGNRAGAAASNPILGDALCFGAQMCAAVYYVYLLGLTKRYAPFTLMKWMFLFASLAVVPLSLPQWLATDWKSFTLAEAGGAAYIVVGATFLSYICVMIGQKNLRPTLVGMYNYVQPVVACAIGIMLGLDTFTAIKILAVALIFSGVYLVNISKAAKTDKN